MITDSKIVNTITRNFPEMVLPQELVKVTNIINHEDGNNFIIKVQPIATANTNTEDDYTLETTSIIPGRGGNGSGMIVKPLIGDLAWAFKSKQAGEKKFVLIGWANCYNGVFNKNSATGIPKDGGISLTVGLIEKSGIDFSTIEGVNLFHYTLKRTSEISINNMGISINSPSGRYQVTRVNGFTKDEILYNDDVYTTRYKIPIPKYTGHVELYTALSSVPTINPFPMDLEDDTEDVSKKTLMMAVLPLSNSLFKGNTYTNKVIIKAGMIYNEYQDLYNFKPQTHLYQLETRQQLLPTSQGKDTTFVMRIGYQKGNYKFTKLSPEAEGTTYEINYKTVNPTGYDSWYYRIGKLKSSDPTTSNYNVVGEIFRNQFYNGVLSAGQVPLIDPCAKGQGYNFVLDKISAAEQYTESFGFFDDTTGKDGTFYRKHMHHYSAPSIGAMYQEQFFNSTLKTSFEKIYRFKNLAEQVSIDMISTSDGKQYKLDLKDVATSITLDFSTDTSGSATIKIITTALPGKSSIFIGDGTDVGQELVTKSWITSVFDIHMHPTAGIGPPSPPLPKIPLIQIPQGGKVNHITTSLKAN